MNSNLPKTVTRLNLKLLRSDIALRSILENTILILCSKSFGHCGQNHVICHMSRLPTTSCSILVVIGRIVFEQKFLLAEETVAFQKDSFFAIIILKKFIILRLGFEVKIYTPIKKNYIKRPQANRPS